MYLLFQIVGLYCGRNLTQIVYLRTLARLLEYIPWIYIFTIFTDTFIL